MTLDACAELVEQGDPERFRTVMAAPPAARAALLPLYAVNLELARAPWASAEPLIAEIRLQWWRDALAGIGRGETPAGHEALGPLAAVVGGDAAAAALLDGMAEARRGDIWREPFADADALMAHIDATAGNLMWLAARCLGARGAAEPVVRDFASGAGLAAWLRAAAELAARGRAPLPEGADVSALARGGLARIARARAARGTAPARARPALWPGWQAAGLLRQAARRPERVAAGRLALPEFAVRGGLLWVVLSGRW